MGRVETVMEQLEKVVKGLECCIMRDPDDELRCDICPYDGRCANRLKIDALALINAQQERIKELEAGQTARVMNENEIKSISGYIWKEYKGMHAMTAVLIEHGMERVPFDGDFPTNELNWSLYNKAWRCWTQRPTDGQRRAAKWDE